MAVVALILFALAAICFFLAAGNVTSRVNLVALGLFCCAFDWFLQVLVPLAR